MATIVEHIGLRWVENSRFERAVEDSTTELRCNNYVKAVQLMSEHDIAYWVRNVCLSNLHVAPC